jgi:hypothetical protein
MHRNHPQVATLVLTNVAKDDILEIFVFSATHEFSRPVTQPIAYANRWRSNR